MYDRKKLMFSADIFGGLGILAMLVRNFPVAINIGHHFLRVVFKATFSTGFNPTGKHAYPTLKYSVSKLGDSELKKHLFDVYHFVSL